MSLKKITEKTKIGIFDSGLGGLSVWSEVVRLMPNHNIIYYADSANCPYGGKNADEILSLTEKGVRWLLAKGAGIIVIACNTATGAAISQLRNKYPEIPFIGLEPAIKKAAELTKSGVIGILATKFTLGSKKYLDTKQRYTSLCTVLEQAGEGLVEQVESGNEESGQTYRLLKKYIGPMMEKGADILVLGCTHYPLLRSQIEKVADGRMKIIDSAPFVAKHLKDVMESAGFIEPTPPAKYSFHSTLSATHSRYIRKKAFENGNFVKEGKEKKQ